MTNRPDFDRINQNVRDKRMSLKEGKAWLALPFIDMPGTKDVISPAYDEFLCKETEGLTNLEMFRSFQTVGFYFQDFVGRFEGSIFRVKISEDWMTFDITSLYSGVSATKSLVKYQLALMPGDDFNLRISALDPFMDSMLKRIPELSHDLASQGIGLLCRLAVLRDYNNQKDRYAVLVAEEKKPKVKGLPTPKDQLRQSQGPRIIYLDALPTTGANNDIEGSHTAKRAHQRRGHWKTLRAERYRFHPKYMVENGIYVKPAWVGPKEAIVDGNIYTILE